MGWTYTLLGQVKGINTPTLSAADDPGKDGNTANTTNDVRDVFGMGFSYHTDDFSRSYNSVNSPFNSGSLGMLTSSLVTTTSTPEDELYSGLLGAATWRTQTLLDDNVDIVREDEVTGETYRYDVLGRLRSLTTHKDNAGTFEAEATGGWSSNYKYDPHGNFLKVFRRGLESGASSIPIDDATFSHVGVTSDLTESIADSYSNQGEHQDVEIVTGNESEYDANGQVLEFSGGANSDVINTFTADGLAATVKRDAITTHILRDAFDQVVRQDVTEGESTGSYFTIPSNSGGDRAVYYRGTSGSPSIKEWTIEGGGRLGVDRTVNSTQDGDVYHRPLNSTLYEMTDQVGSVRAIVSDVVEADANNAGLFLAQVLSASDYEPFGSRRMMRHSDVTDGSYRYGWQGMRLFDGHEKRFDYITQFRLFDTRMGRWQSSDPVFNPGVSPYEGMGSNPLGLTDPLGLWVRAIGGDAEAAIKSSVGDFSAFVQFEGGILQIAPLREGVAKAMARPGQKHERRVEFLQRQTGIKSWTRISRSWHDWPKILIALRSKSRLCLVLGKRVSCNLGNLIMVVMP